MPIRARSAPPDFAFKDDCTRRATLAGSNSVELSIR
jgi:hypothetical protein